MADEISRFSVPAQPPLRRLLPIEPDGGVVNNRSLTVVVINVPAAASAARAPALRPIRPVTRWMPAVPQVRFRRVGRWAALFPALLLIAGGAANWWALPRRGADEPVDAIRFMLPAPKVEVPLQPASDWAGAPGHPAVVQSGPASLVPSRKQALRPAAAVSGAASGALAEIGDLPEVAAATRLALRSGVAQRWQAKGLSGVAVAGPVQLDDSNVCRTIAVLADGGAGGQTVQSVRCMTRAGTWVSRAPVAAADAPALAAPTRSDGGSADPASDGAVR